MNFLLFFFCFSLNILSSPLYQQEAFLIGKESGENSLQGSSTAISGNGEVVIVGAPLNNDDQGGVFIYTFSEQTQQYEQVGDMLLGNDVSAIGGRFGFSTAISENAEVILIGSFSDDDYHGSCWFYVKNGDKYVQHGQKFTGEPRDQEGGFGWSVALSGNGDIALIGSPDVNEIGNVFIMVRDRTTNTWNKTSILFGEGSIQTSQQGSSVALDRAGVTALVGAVADNDYAGAAWIFNYNENTKEWEQYPEVIRLNNEDKAWFGSSVSLNADGTMALIGARRDSTSASFITGAAYVYAKNSSGGWNLEAKLVDPNAQNKQSVGTSVSLSSDGTIAVIGAPSEDPLNTQPAYSLIFIRNETDKTWSLQNSSTLVGDKGFVKQGTSVKISGNKQKIVVGADAFNFSTNRIGGAFVFNSTRLFADESTENPTSSPTPPTFYPSTAPSSSPKKSLSIISSPSTRISLHFIILIWC